MANQPEEEHRARVSFNAEARRKLLLSREAALRAQRRAQAARAFITGRGRSPRI